MNDQQKFEEWWDSNYEVNEHFNPDVEAAFLAALEIGRRERTVEIADETLKVMSCVCAKHIRRKYPECFKKGE